MTLQSEINNTKISYTNHLEMANTQLPLNHTHEFPRLSRVDVALGSLTPEVFPGRARRIVHADLQLTHQDGTITLERFDFDLWTGRAYGEQVDLRKARANPQYLRDFLIRYLQKRIRLIDFRLDPENVKFH